MNENINSASYEQSVRQIQTFLYSIAQTDPDIPRVNPDGIYSPQTADSVLAFQSKHSLKKTGKVDFETWKKLYDEFLKSDELLSEPEKISPFSASLKNGELVLGDVSDTVSFLKLMLKTISIELDDLALLNDDAVFDEPTFNAVLKLQQIYGLEENGKVDLLTWNMIAKSFNKYVRYNQ